VHYGRLIEPTRQALAERRLSAPRWLRLGLRQLLRPRLLRAGASAIAVTQRVGVRWTRFGLTRRLPLRQRPLQASGDEVYLFTGCVMDAFQRDVHAATQRVIEATGAGVEPTGDVAPCCGALHAHAGLHDEAVGIARRVIRALSTDSRPILVNSAGCGAAMKHYGDLLDTDEARVFSRRVMDVSEWLATRADRLSPLHHLGSRVAVQDPCHLRHVQRVHMTTRAVLSNVCDLAELDDDGLCCGAGGAYSWVHPTLASEIRTRKLAAIERSGVEAVVSANPGCSMFLTAAGVRTYHPMELVDQAITLHRRAERVQDATTNS
jgi:glycolate oxidase iron-sulfur subunit